MNISEWSNEDTRKGAKGSDSRRGIPREQIPKKSTQPKPDKGGKK